MNVTLNLFGLVIEIEHDRDEILITIKQERPTKKRIPVIIEERASTHQNTQPWSVDDEQTLELVRTLNDYENYCPKDARFDEAIERLIAWGMVKETQIRDNIYWTFTPQGKLWACTLIK